MPAPQVQIGDGVEWSCALEALDGRRIVLVPRAVGAGHVEDDLGGGNGGRFAVHGGEGAEEQVADIGQDSGTARGDLVVGKELVQFAEGMVDAGGGLESLGLACEGGSKFSEVTLFALLISVFETEAGVVVGNGQTAKAATGEAKLTMEQRGDGNDARRFGSHDGSILGRVDTHPGCFRKSGKQKTCGRVSLYEWQIKELVIRDR